MSSAMSFFQHQEQARRSTVRLVGLFALAVAATMAVTYLVVAAAWVLTANSRKDVFKSGVSLWQPELLVLVGAGVLLVVGVGAAIKLVQLWGGGRAVAEGLGARRIEPGLASGDERKVLNVVEEMALASGIPVPPVYLLEEGAINACAAGYSPGDAVVMVTRGSVEHLTRDELQGVIGHEFSHILNGDMRLNIRLIEVLHGIIAIGLAGRILLRAVTSGGRGRSSRSGKGDGGGLLVLLALGGALVVIGYIGLFFGKWIQAAISRQREFLADASSVQFTRNPGGIAGALRKIGGSVRGSRIDHEGAEQVSHMFFSQSSTSWLDRFMATHPPLADRIRRVDPAWDGQFTRVEIRSETVKAQAAVTGTARMAGAVGQAAVVDEVGRLRQLRVGQAAGIIEHLPESIRAAAGQPFGACALVYAMLFSGEGEVRGRQLEELGRGGPKGMAEAAGRLVAGVESLEPGHRLVVVELAMPALRQMSSGQYEEFRARAEALIRADGQVNLFEWVLERYVLRTLESQFGRAAPRRVQYYGLGRLARECSVLLSALAYIGQRDVGEARRAFAVGAGQLGTVGSSLEMVAAEECGLSAVDGALRQFEQVAPRLKRDLGQACAATVLADGRVSGREAELLRGVLAMLDCPTPLGGEGCGQGGGESRLAG